MPSTTSATAPLSYYEVLSTFWAAACPACGTDLRGQSLVNLDVLGPVPHGLIVELGSKLRPARIEYGFGQAGSGKSAGIDIADTDAPALPHKPPGQLMQEVLAAVRDLGVDGLHAGLASGTLCDSERPFVSVVNSRRLDLLTRGKSRQRLEAEVDADLANPMYLVFRNLNLEIQVPAAAGVLSETAAANLPFEGAAEPQSISTPEEDCRVPVHAYRASRLEGDPTQGLSAAPSRPLAMCIPREGKLLADRLYGVRVQAQEIAAPGGELDQIEAGRPALIVPASGFLDPAAVVPDPAHRTSLLLKMPAGGRILDPVPVGQHHGNIVIDGCYKSKIDAKHLAGIFTLESASEVPAGANMCGATRLGTGFRDASRRRSRVRRSWHLSPPRRDRRGFRRGEFR